MFGQIKESILTELETLYNEDKELFKEKLNKFHDTILNSKELKGIYGIYDLVKNKKFVVESEARSFVDDCISELTKVGKDGIKDIRSLVEGDVKKEKDTINYYLDELAFNSKLLLSKKIENKTNLVKLLTNNIDPVKLGESIKESEKKITESLTKLGEDEVKVVNLMLENDQEKIKNFYNGIIEETKGLVEENILKAEDSGVVKKLVEVVRKLNGMKKEEATIDNINNIIDLKKSF